MGDYMKLVKLDRILIGVMLMFSGSLQAQDYKNNISIVQFSAEFVKSSEISLKQFDRHNIYTFHLEKKGDVFAKEKIKFLPTIVVYENGEEKLRIESNIRLELPDNAADQVDAVLEEILNNKF